MNPSVHMLSSAECQHQTEQWSLKSDPLPLDGSSFVFCAILSSILALKVLRDLPVPLSRLSPCIPVPGHKEPPSVPQAPRALPEPVTQSPGPLPSHPQWGLQAKRMPFLSSWPHLRRITTTPSLSSVEKLAQKAQARGRQELEGEHHYLGSQKPGTAVTS